MQSKQAEKFITDVEKLGLKFPVAAIARETGYSKSNVSEYLNRKKEPSEKFLKKFYEVYDADKNIGDGKNELSDDGAQYLPQSGNISEKSLSMQAILSLTRSNEKLANANADLSRNTLELTQLVKQFANAPQENYSISQATIAELLVLIAEVGSGKRWHSTDEALAVLNKRFYDIQKNEQATGIHHG